MKRVPLLSAIRVALGALFLWSGFLKLIEPWQNFHAVIEVYRLVSGDPARWIAQILPWVEALGGLYLLAGLYVRATVVLLWVSNAVFLTALIQAVIRKLPIRECGCFGDAFSIPLPAMITVDAVIFFAFAMLYIWKDEAARFSLDRFFSKKGRQ